MHVMPQAGYAKTVLRIAVAVTVTYSKEMDDNRIFMWLRQAAGGQSVIQKISVYHRYRFIWEQYWKNVMKKNLREFPIMEILPHYFR